MYKLKPLDSLFAGDNDYKRVYGLYPWEVVVIESPKSKILGALRSALERLNKTYPCPHINIDTRLGNGRIWAKCEDCSATIEQGRLPIYRAHTIAHEKAIEQVLEAIELVRA